MDKEGAFGPILICSINHFTLLKMTTPIRILQPTARVSRLFVLVLWASLWGLGLGAQTPYHQSSASIRLDGTSTLHDWFMESKQSTCDATFTGTDLSGIQSLNFSLPVTTLKSEKDGLDKNAYEAMKSDKYPKLSFTLGSGSSVVKENAGYRIACKGTLTIAGSAQPVTLSVLCKMNTDKSITCTGTYKMKMTTFGVQPPRLMMGAIKTGDDITITFTVQMKP
jgi:polyisoprenoid-binding protein YceI